MTTIADKSTAAPSGFDGKPRRIHWTCRYDDCLRSFTTWTRRGLRVTCPHCHRVQEGPAGVRRLLERTSTKAKPKVATTLKIVAVGNGRKAPAAQPPVAKAAPVKPAPPKAPPPPPKKDLLSRALGF